MRPLVFTLFVVLLGCLPERDNPNDPRNQPLVVLEAQAAGEPPGLMPWTAPVELRSDRSEPREHALTVQWFQRADGEADWTAIHDAPVPTTEPVVTRFHDFVPKGALMLDTSNAAQATTWSLRADVRDPVTNGFATGEISVIVVNRPPVLAAPAVHEVPPGGRWWAGGARIVTPISAKPSDPDGADDALRVTWSLVSGSGFSLAPSNADLNGIEVTMPTRESRGVLLAAVTDSAGLVSTARVQLAVRDVLWHTEPDGSIVRTRDTARQIFADEPYWAVATGGEGASQVVWGVRPADANGIWRYDVGSTGLGVAVGFVDSAHTFAGGTGAADGGAWIAFRDRDSQDASLRRVTPAGATLFTRTDLPVLLVDASNTSFFPSAVDADVPTGGAWVLLGDELDASAVLLGSGGASLFAPVPIPLGSGRRAHGIHADGTGGAWLVLADELDFSGVPRLIHLSAAGLVDMDFDAPAAAGAAQTLAVDPISGRVVIESVGGGGIVTLWKLDPPSYTAEPYATHTAVASDLVFDPLDGGLWTVRPDVGAMRKTATDGAPLAGTSALTPGAPSSAGITVDATGRAWVVDHSANRLHGIGADATQPVRSNALQLPREIRYDPVRNRVFSISVPEGIAVELGGDGVPLRTWDLLSPPFDHAEGASSIDVDPRSGVVWIAGRATQSTRSRLWRVKADGVVEEISLPPDVLAIWSIEADPVSSELCLAGSNYQPNTTGSTDEAYARVVRLSPSGVMIRDASFGIVPGSINSAERVRARGSDCFFLTQRSGQGYGSPTQMVGRLFGNGSVCLLPIATTTAQRIAASPTTDDIFWLQRTSSKVRRASLAEACTPAITIDIELENTIWSNPTDIAVDPVTGAIIVSAAPEPGNGSASAILRFSATGAQDRSPNRVHESLEPQRVTVNR